MLVAVDTNVPLDLAQGIGDVADALGVIRECIAGVRPVAPPTVALELVWLSEFADEDDVRAAAQTALRSLASSWGIQPVNLVPVGHGIVDAIAAKIRAQGLLPVEETHDALILAESAVLECSMLLNASHVASPIIATPREIVRKFFC